MADLVAGFQISRTALTSADLGAETSLPWSVRAPALCSEYEAVHPRKSSKKRIQLSDPSASRFAYGVHHAIFKHLQYSTRLTDLRPGTKTLNGSLADTFPSLAALAAAATKLARCLSSLFGRQTNNSADCIVPKGPKHGRRDEATATSSCLRIWVNAGASSREAGPAKTLSQPAGGIMMLRDYGGILALAQVNVQPYYQTRLRMRARGQEARPRPSTAYMTPEDNNRSRRGMLPQPSWTLYGSRHQSSHPAVPVSVTGLRKRNVPPVPHPGQGPRDVVHDTQLNAHAPAHWANPPTSRRRSCTHAPKHAKPRRLLQ
ncbi:hypothetical protein HIM_09168 [Hirsutella minnesotensis 3608]|uniref:Uncharacterized protein n=1 Tax=Hirsutella minnesotensis 3608 TaxID=1043627 RepID=A0A0F8A396_9HYPO|nr:hypothetical protein HIM_09168 [Hirsutella minnesotensis 3608]